jgi:hypothetical protein
MGFWDWFSHARQARRGQPPLRRGQFGAHKIHGEEDGEIGETGEIGESVELIMADDAETYEPDFGRGSTGEAQDHSLLGAGGGMDPFALASFGVDVPRGKKRGPATSATHTRGRAKKHAIHGEEELPDIAPDAGDTGDDGSNEPNYGAGPDADPFLAMGEDIASDIPGGNAGLLHGGGRDEYQLDDYTDDVPQAYRPLGPDPYDSPQQIPNRRNYKAGFGADLYHFHSAAPVIGLERSRLKR